MDKFINFVTNFLEKYLIPTLIAISITIATYYFTPEQFSVFEKLGKELYLIGIFAIVFLVVKLIIYLFKTIKRIISNKITEKEQKTKAHEENIKRIKNMVDELSPNERKLLDLFLKNNNEEIYAVEEPWNSLLMNLCNKNEVVLQTKTKILDLYSFQTFESQKGYKVNRYKLKKEIYDIFKNMLDNNIKISNFD